MSGLFDVVLYVVFGILEIVVDIFWVSVSPHRIWMVALTLAVALLILFGVWALYAH